MADKNYLEFVLPTHDTYSDKTNGVEWENEDELIWWAVKPSTEKSRYRKRVSSENEGEVGEWQEESNVTNYWRINGEMTIYTKDDITALRGLLDLIEAELPKEN